MKFSIIVPVYNSERYLPQCIESVLSQTHSSLSYC
jgi:glycosyltransferase involved in cell wall biosynthesis